MTACTLIVDAEDMRLLLAAVARRGGFETVRVCDGGEVLELHEPELRPAVVVTTSRCRS